MTACQEMMAAYPEKMEANLEEIKSIVKHHEVAKEEGAVETVRALEDR
jgi:hypothetical protein